MFSLCNCSICMNGLCASTTVIININIVKHIIFRVFTYLNCPTAASWAQALLLNAFVDCLYFNNFSAHAAFIAKVHDSESWNIDKLWPQISACSTADGHQLDGDFHNIIFLSKCLQRNFLLSLVVGVKLHK